MLPLTGADQDAFNVALARIPANIGATGLYVRERKGENGIEVVVYSLQGSRFNRLLTLLLRHRLGGRVQVRYNDFVVRILHAGKEGAGERVANAVREIQGMGSEEIESLLPVPPTEGWKFARALPGPLLREMAFTDHYHVEECTDILGQLTVTVLCSPHPAPPLPPPGP